MPRGKPKLAPVVAKVRTKMGISNYFVPEGTKGMGRIYTARTNLRQYWYVEWTGTYGVGQHPLDEVETI